MSDILDSRKLQRSGRDQMVAMMEFWNHMDLLHTISAVRIGIKLVDYISRPRTVYCKITCEFCIPPSKVGVNFVLWICNVAHHQENKGQK